MIRHDPAPPAATPTGTAGLAPHPVGSPAAWNWSRNCRTGSESLIIDLVAPDGTAYRLKNQSFFDGADNVNTTYTANLSSEAANGTWLLRVRDVYAGDTGYINTWTLTLEQ
jgi:hypothetical protein